MVDITWMKEEDVISVSNIEKNTFSSPWSVDAFREAVLNTDAIYLVAQKDREIIAYVGAQIGRAHA